GDGFEHPGHFFDRTGQPPSGDHADRPAQEADDARLHEELLQYVKPLCAHGHAHANLARPLSDRHEHDVHDPNPAADETDAGNGAEHDAHQRLEAAELVHELLL